MLLRSHTHLATVPVTMSRRGRPLMMLLAAAVLATLGCGGSTPRDINYGTDAEASFEVPPFEAKPKDATDVSGASDASDASDAGGGAAGTGGAGSGGTAGTGGAAGADAAAGDTVSDGAGNSSEAGQ